MSRKTVIEVQIEPYSHIDRVVSDFDYTWLLHKELDQLGYIVQEKNISITKARRSSTTSEIYFIYIIVDETHPLYSILFIREVEEFNPQLKVPTRVMTGKLCGLLQDIITSYGIDFKTTTSFYYKTT